MAAGKESRARSAKEAAKSAVSPPGSSCGEPGAGPQLLTSGEVALQLLRGERRGGGGRGGRQLLPPLQPRQRAARQVRPRVQCSDAS